MTFARLVPAYLNPARHDLWAQLYAQLRPGDIAILNPDSGPGTEALSDWIRISHELRLRGIGVFGYVPAAYGKAIHQWRPDARPTRVADVPERINRWASWYAPDGIMLDEFPADGTGDTPLLAASILYARRRCDPRADSVQAQRCILNMGTVPSAAVIAALPVVRCVIVHEDRDGNGPSVDDIGVPPATALSPRRQAFLAYNDPDPERTLARLEELGWGYGWSTSDPAPAGNAWDMDAAT